MVERTVRDSWKIELEKELKKLAEELRKAELDTHQEEEKTNEEYFDVLYAPYTAGHNRIARSAVRNKK